MVQAIPDRCIQKSATIAYYYYLINYLMSQFFGKLFFRYTQRVSTIGAPLLFLYKWFTYFCFTKLTRPGIDNIYVTEKQNTMFDEDYFDAYYDELEDRYEGDEWDYDGFY